MKRNIIYLVLFVTVLISSCQSNHDKRIQVALSLAENGRPDSALIQLNKIDQSMLSDLDMAMYSLAYTMAQDKTGIDIDNDSLIRTAYTYYYNRPEDSLYAKSQYYMGKYYALNDSSEKALQCFRKSIVMAKRKHDYDTQCLSLFQQSLILREYDPDKAMLCAKAANSIYNNLKGSKLSNKAYYLLNLAECIRYKNDNPNICISLARKAIRYAIQSKDSVTISNSYQDLASFYALGGNITLALKATSESLRYNNKDDFSKIFALSQFYVLADSLTQAKRKLSEALPLNINDSCAYYSLKRDIAIKESDLANAESLADSTDFYLDKKNSENLKTRNTYYSLMLQKEIARTKALSESKWKSYVILLIAVSALIIILLMSFIFFQKKKQMNEKYEKGVKLHNMEIEHKEIQITTMRKFLLSKIGIIQRLQSLNQSKHKLLLLSKDDWEEIEIFLNSTDNDFVVKIKDGFPELTTKDIQFLMLVKLKLPYKSIALIYNIEEKSVKQRMFLFKKKLGLQNSKMSTKEFIERY